MGFTGAGGGWAVPGLWGMGLDKRVALQMANSELPTNRSPSWLLEEHKRPTASKVYFSIALHEGVMQCRIPGAHCTVQTVAGSHPGGAGDSYVGAL